ncbi:MAG: hypothetical protein VB140_03450 [Burkholderia sp.]
MQQRRELHDSSPVCYTVRSYTVKRNHLIDGNRHRPHPVARRRSIWNRDPTAALASAATTDADQAIGALLAWPRLGLHVSFGSRDLHAYSSCCSCSPAGGSPSAALPQRRAILALAFGWYLSPWSAGYFGH